MGEHLISNLYGKKDAGKQHANNKAMRLFFQKQ